MQQQCNHNEFCDAPIVGTFVSGGRVINTRCRGDLKQVILGMKLLTRRVPQIIPVNNAVKQVSRNPEPATIEVNHAD